MDDDQEEDVIVQEDDIESEDEENLSEDGKRIKAVMDGGEIKVTQKNTGMDKDGNKNGETTTQIRLRLDIINDDDDEEDDENSGAIANQA